MSSQLNLQDVINAAKTVYFPDLWNEIVNFFGEENAKSIDFTYDFDYLEIIKNGSKEECRIYYFINTIQQYIVSTMFDMQDNNEAMISYCYLQKLSYLLGDKWNGKEEHLWLH